MADDDHDMAGEPRSIVCIARAVQIHLQNLPNAPTVDLECRWCQAKGPWLLWSTGTVSGAICRCGGEKQLEVTLEIITSLAVNAVGAVTPEMRRPIADVRLEWLSDALLPSEEGGWAPGQPTAQLSRLQLVNNDDSGQG